LQVVLPKSPPNTRISTMHRKWSSSLQEDQDRSISLSAPKKIFSLLFLQPRGSSHLVNRRLKISLELEVEKDKMHGYHDPNYAVLVVFLVIYFPIYIYIILESQLLTNIETGIFNYKKMFLLSFFIIYSFLIFFYCFNKYIWRKAFIRILFI